MAFERITSYQRDGLTFDVRDQGPLDGPVVVLLHGFPQDSRSWEHVAAGLNEAGYRTLAPDQRGYSPGARPRGRRAYVGAELAADVVALIERAGPATVHLVGHDWGSAPVWELAATRGDLLRSVTSLSTPHPAAFVKAITTTRQGLKSWYMFVFQIPWLPDWVLSHPKPAARSLSRRMGQTPEYAARDAARLAEPGLSTAAINWYRGAVLGAGARRAPGPSVVPTLYVWSDADNAIGEIAPRWTEKHVRAPYSFHVLPGVSHWIPDQAPDAVLELLIPHLRANDPA